jgi:hypothetical protein
MSEKELIFDAGEMRLLRIGCTKCGTRILFDCAKAEAGVPTNCPCCSQVFGESANWIAGYRKLYNAAPKNKEATFQFQVSMK